MSDYYIIIMMMIIILIALQNIQSEADKDSSCAFDNILHYYLY